MFTNLKRFTAFMLALVMVFALLPTGMIHAHETAEEPREISQEAYAEADAVFDLIDASESGPAKKNATQEEKTEDAIAIVMASDSYVEGSLERNGDAFSWFTDDGIRCMYNPRMQEIQQDQTPETSIDEIVNEPIATKGGYPTGNQVYLIGPYYGSDPDFTDQYKKEAQRIATAIGDTDGYTLYSGKAATIDKVAEAVSNGAVVIFDSHGTTDYQNPRDEYDYVTGAEFSYLCLATKTGLTNEDYADGAGYYSDGSCAVNGAAIANHMSKNSPNGIVWMAICLGMATDTMFAPLREMGVEVVYGYSQSVSFDGDYLFEETFWAEMIAGNTVAGAIATMKSKWGNWDWSDEIADYYYNKYYEPGYSTIAAARAYYAAFPIVVSDEDTWPGQRTGGSNYGADTLQTVKSTYTLFVDCDHIWTEATCTAASICTECGRTNGSPLPHNDVNGDDFCDVCGADTSTVIYVKVTTAPSDWSGKYLIVYEDGSLAFDGSLTTLDAVSNTVDVDIESGKITLNPDEDSFYFVIEKYSNGYSIQSASGTYIGGKSGSNMIVSGKAANTISISGGYADIESNTSHLRFNAANDQMRFRYFKSTSYSNQQGIALYRVEKNVTSCEHVFTNKVSGTIAVAATCTAPAQYYVQWAIIGRMRPVLLPRLAPFVRQQRASQTATRIPTATTLAMFAEQVWAQRHPR